MEGKDRQRLEQPALCVVLDQAATICQPQSTI